MPNFGALPRLRRKRRRRSRALGSACLFAPDPVSRAGPRRRIPILESADAPLPLLPADPARDAEGSGDRLAPADAARRHDPAGGGRHLRLAAARPARAEQDRADRARGAEPRRRARTADADHPVGRPLARERPLRRLRQGDAAHQGPARARHALRADQRGDDHRDLPRLCALLQGPAAQPLPHPVEVPRRGAAALRRDARPRVPDEGRLFLRPRPGRRAALLQPDVRRLSAHLRAAGPEGDPDARRHRPDRRRPQPRVHHPRRHRRERGVLPQRLSRLRRCRARTSNFDDVAGLAGHRRQVDVALRRDRRDARRGGLRRSRRPTSGSRRAASRSATSSISAPNTPSR